MKHKGIYVWTAALLFTVLSAAFFASSALAQDDSGDEDAFGNIMNTGYPAIGAVNFAAPAAGAPCKVSASIKLMEAKDYDNYSIKSVKLTYIVNGDRAGAKSVDMVAGGDTYTAEIPAMPAGAKVAFYITAVDSLGNTSTEALPVDSKDKAAAELVAGVPDMDNSAEFIDDSVDLLGTYVGYDKDYIYAGYDTQGDIKGGTIDPPYIQIYAVKFTNPDVDTQEGLMNGKMWVYLPVALGTDAFIKALPGQITGVISSLPQDVADRVKQSGMFVLDMSKLLNGDWNNGLIFTAEATQLKTDSPKKFAGFMKRSVLGDNPSGFYRMIVFTAANAALDNFMPIPFNCSHFIQIYTRDHEYEVK